jgi:cystathionine gamma-synthase
MDCFLTLRGMKTLALRMERHCENALAVARMLEDHTRVTEVYYPGLESHPQHELAKQQMHGFGGMVSFLLDGDEASAREVVSRTEVFLLAESLGAVESLIEHPHSMTHASTADSHIATPANLIRLSVGIEHIEDLLADLKRALA